MANEFDIFSVSVKDLDTGDRPQTTSDLYTPKPDQGSDGTYRSLIRFLPNVKNPRKPFVRKYVYWLEDQRKNQRLHPLFSFFRQITDDGTVLSEIHGTSRSCTPL